MNPEDKCPHGVYKAGDRVARHCQMCTPGVHDRTLRGLANFKPNTHGAVTERVLSAAAFMSLPVGARLASLEET